MSLIESISLGLSVPHRSLDDLSVAEIRDVALRAEAIGFEDLWVTNNTVDRKATCLDSLTELSFLAGFTSRIRLGVSVLILPHYHPIHVAHQVASLDFLSEGRTVLGIGLGRPSYYEDFQVPVERRVGRFKEQLALMKALWTESPVTFHGEFYQVQDAVVSPRPVQQPHPPIWMGGHAPKAVRRAADLADGWMGAGGAGTDLFRQNVKDLSQALADAGRSTDDFKISKRVFISIHEDPGIAREELHRWFAEVYETPQITDEGGVYGTPEQVLSQLCEIADAGASHLLLNPVTRFREHVGILEEMVNA